MKFSVYGVTGQTGTKAHETSTNIKPLVYGSENISGVSGELTKLEIIECQKMANENRILLPTHLNINVDNLGSKKGHSKGVAPLLPIV